MKKLIALLLAVVMVATVAAGCTSKEKEDDKKTNVVVPESALEILETIWNGVPEDSRFPAMGGDTTNPIENAPGVFSLDDGENVTYSLLVPADELDNLIGAASLVNMMMTNNFTCGVFHVKGDAEDFADTMTEALKNNQWMCGMPDAGLVAVVGGEYVLMAYGIEDFLNPFEDQLDKAYPDAQKVFDDSLL